jgi:molecular chaperone DnaK (HSP70)
MCTFFQPLFEKIEGKTEELMGQAKEKDAPVNFIFMVGGFSESPYLKAQIKKKFE